MRELIKLVFNAAGEKPKKSNSKNDMGSSSGTGAGVDSENTDNAGSGGAGGNENNDRSDTSTATLVVEEIEAAIGVRREVLETILTILEQVI